MKKLLTLIACLTFSHLLIAKPLHLRDKIGQMLIIGFTGSEVDEQTDIGKTIENDNLGGVILFDKDNNITSPAQLKHLNTTLQNITKAAAKKRNQPYVPLLISIDYEGGAHGTRLNPSQGFPATISAAEVGKMSTKEAEIVANGMAETLYNTGINLNFAPVVDVNINPDSPIIGKYGRSFSKDPNEVTHFSSLYSKAFLSHHVQCAYKHFPGHGSATGDSHLGFVDVSHDWQPIELMPYQQLLRKEGACGFIMTAHIVNRQLDSSGLPATLSHKILTTLLRNKLHFKGVIISDDMQMKAISSQYSLDQAIALAINAGADMLIFANQLQTQDTSTVINLIESKVRTGEISEKRINDAYRRIQRMKMSLQ